ncbi:class I SAM-dependent methyltransferase [Aureitalea marina]|uniref:Methyltransferase n=1 Tax=Aureitalea marina TaxID=930804 RepID=A0A2S7KSB3_9FLAO|nr:class I SAM-dependent methyltransferase [Aureitalea marina]PQB05468.1 hypothetical protein BST85_11630 [Aureitalea marina]
MAVVPRETFQKTWPDTVSDHMVSQEVFQLRYEARWDLLRTEPVPTPDRLSSYYQSGEYLSHKDEDTSLFGRVYMMLRKWSIKQKYKRISALGGSSKRLLDIGCGTGDFLYFANRSGWNATGVEPDSGARSLALDKSLDVRSQWADLDEPKYDVITMWHVLEHIPELEACCKKLVDLLKPGGTLIIAVPNYRSWDAVHYGPHWAAYDVPRHLWHFSKNSFGLLFQDSLSLDDNSPMYLDPFYVALLSERYRGNRMIWVRAVISGLRSIIFGWRKGEHSSHIYTLTKPKMQNKPL